MPEIGGLAFGFSQHDDLLLGQGGGKRGVLLTQQEIIIGPGHSCREEDINKGSGPERFRLLENGTHVHMGLVDKLVLVVGSACLSQTSF